MQCFFEATLWLLSESIAGQGIRLKMQRQRIGRIKGGYQECFHVFQWRCIVKFV